ncbi:hypothetical protein ERICIII_04838 (plasmid) [Paenibacillus larvae subsp. larvae]|uniref:Uncharacterized protein n=1 Tax=Paenibacillus larvae subsp. larvae TaxID=147375 RepID=A0A2L1U7E8_9BACL|nr:hypothetical protein ERICIII_04838 [Paenibacillus larvae subsp. larvae]
MIKFSQLNKTDLIVHDGNIISKKEARKLIEQGDTVPMFTLDGAHPIDIEK